MDGADVAQTSRDGERDLFGLGTRIGTRDRGAVSSREEIDAQNVVLDKLPEPINTPHH